MADLICLNYKVPVSDLTLQRFEKTVEDCVNVTEAVAQKIAAYSESRLGAPGPAQDPDKLNMRV